MKKSSHGTFKRLFLCFLFLYLVITLAPAALYYTVPGPSDPPAPPAASPDPEESAAPTAAPLPDPLSGMSIPGESKSPAEAGFTLYDTATDQTLQVDARDFLAAGLACEMDLQAPEEALKAQAVAAYTYYSRMRQSGQEIACDTENWLVYVPEETMRQRWGEDYDSYKALLDKVVDQVYGQALTYQGELILASYFAISPGSTENVENVWSEDANLEHPYLQAVASPGDMFSDGYLSYAEFTEDEFREAVGAFFEDDPPDLSGPGESWLTDVVYTPSGMVKSASLGGVTVTGAQLRSALGLRSASFQCDVSEGILRFTVRGWGHGVGMSQAGAVFLAKRGADYREILAHYYPGTELEVF